MSATEAVSRSRRAIRVVAFLALLAAILALAWFAYRQGLGGAFLFDDLGSLPKLGATGPVDNWATFWRYITSGSADPTGRPLAMLSFLLDARTWPADPYPFKLTNLVLHLLNGALLAWVLWKLGCALGRASAPASSPMRRPESTPASPSIVIPGPPPVSPVVEPGIQLPWSAAEPMEVDSGFRPSGGPGMTIREKRALGGRPPPTPAVTPVAGSHALLVTDSRAIAIAALFGAGAWLLHPFLVSTTLYVVQREAMLPATFTLLAILGWIASREALARGHARRALVGMALSAWLCTLLAFLSKANGALLPLLLLLVEWIVLAPRQPMPSVHGEQLRKRAVAVFLIVPTLLLAAYLLYALPGEVRSAPDVRGWTVGQRLLTEPRVLTDYLRLLFVPHAYSSGLFNDAFPVSTGWLHPASTLPCIALILALIGLGFALRKRHPAIALALLFYFAAQLMESGWIPLELYFEHRNYLPAMLLFWPIGIGLARAGSLRGVRIACAAALLLVLAGLTWQRATLWGNAPNQARVWATLNPQSARAQTSAALYDLQNGQPQLAATRLQRALPAHPHEVQIAANLITAECRIGPVQPGTLAAARVALATDRVGGGVAFNAFVEMIATSQRHACSGLDHAAVQGLLAAAERNPYWLRHAGLRANLIHVQGILALSQHDPRRALQEFNQALAERPEPGTALNQAATLGSAGYPALGLAHLDYFDTLRVARPTGFSMARIHAWVLRRQGWWPQQFAHLREVLEADAAGASAANNGVRFIFGSRTARNP